MFLIDITGSYFWTSPDVTLAAKFWCLWTLLICILLTIPQTVFTSVILVWVSNTLFTVWFKNIIDPKTLLLIVSIMKIMCQILVHIFRSNSTLNYEIQNGIPFKTIHDWPLLRAKLRTSCNSLCQSISKSSPAATFSKKKPRILSSASTLCA